MQFFRTYFLVTVFLTLCLPFTAFAQWSPSNNSSTSNSIYRTGKVGVGLAVEPYAQLHVGLRQRASLPGQEVVLPPALRLERTIDASPFVLGGTFAWDFLPGRNLSIRLGDGASSSPVLSMNPNVLGVSGRALYLGYGVGNPAAQFKLAYSNDFRGYYLGFNGTEYGGNWRSPGAKVAIQSNGEGYLHFITGGSGDAIPFGQNQRLTITPEGTTIVGQNQENQVLRITAERNSILQFTGLDGRFEMLRNGAGDLEFWNGQNSTGTDTPPAMRLNTDGKLLIGTNLSPNVLNEGGDDEIDIANYRLYVEGGILTKEMRVRSVWADYVFEDDYRLLSLPLVKRYIEQNGHLHNTPSGAEIERVGLEVGDMMANQQEKIEEVFLHLIEMNEQIQALKKKNKELEDQIKMRQ